MIINFRIHNNSQNTHKLARLSTLIKIIIKKKLEIHGVYKQELGIQSYSVRLTAPNSLAL